MNVSSFQEIEKDLIGAENQSSDRENPLVLPSRKRKVVFDAENSQKQPRKLSKRERKRLQKVVEHKAKKLKVQLY